MIMFLLLSQAGSSDDLNYKTNSREELVEALQTRPSHLRETLILVLTRDELIEDSLIVNLLKSTSYGLGMLLPEDKSGAVSIDHLLGPVSPHAIQHVHYGQISGSMDLLIPAIIAPPLKPLRRRVPNAASSDRKSLDVAWYVNPIATGTTSPSRFAVIVLGDHHDSLAELLFQAADESLQSIRNNTVQVMVEWIFLLSELQQAAAASDISSQITSIEKVSQGKTPEERRISLTNVHSAGSKYASCLHGVDVVLSEIGHLLRGTNDKGGWQGQFTSWDLKCKRTLEMVRGGVVSIEREIELLLAESNFELARRNFSLDMEIRSLTVLGAAIGVSGILIPSIKPSPIPIYIEGWTDTILAVNFATVFCSVALVLLLVIVFAKFMKGIHQRIEELMK